MGLETVVFSVVLLSYRHYLCIDMDKLHIPERHLNPPAKEAFCGLVYNDYSTFDDLGGAILDGSYFLDDRRITPVHYFCTDCVENIIHTIDFPGDDIQQYYAHSFLDVDNRISICGFPQRDLFEVDHYTLEDHRWRDVQPFSNPNWSFCPTCFDYTLDEVTVWEE